MGENEPTSSQTLRASSTPAMSVATTNLDLSTLPPIYLSSTHFETEDLHELEEVLLESGAVLTYDINEARIVLSKVTRKARIQLDLRSKGLWTEEVPRATTDIAKQVRASPRPAKKPRLDHWEGIGRDEAKAIVIDDSSTASEAEEAARDEVEPVKKRSPPEQKQHGAAKAPSTPPSAPLLSKTPSVVVAVLRLEWYEDSRRRGTALPFHEYLSYHGRCIERPTGAETPSPARNNVLHSKVRSTVASQNAHTSRPHMHGDILERANADAPKHGLTAYQKYSPHKFGKHSVASSSATYDHGGSSTQYARLLQQSTSEDDSNVCSDLPEPPDWVKQQVKYACQRLTPKTNPNDPLIKQLKKIKLARLLTNDEIGVRAYSTSIAALAAYPYKISNPREILALPGCDAKIANLYVEYANTGGKIQAADDAEKDGDLKILRLFYEIWGVGATTAREFYYERGWKELDDIVEFGWSTLTRVQQIGVKHYDEFLDPIPRAEVELIASVIHRHAVRVRNDNIRSLVVGGYRRGKKACGDVDIIVSHPDESQTLNVVNDIVASLEEEGWITHTLLLSLHSTNRGQQTLPFRSGGASGGHGFDTLDKALVVWQDPVWATEDADLATNPKAKNPNIHRRVDIIVSAWRTVGCAVAGWSGGTTFQRDLRRYAKNVKGWKFDSSGVRDRANGEFVDLEGWSGPYHRRAKTMEDAERRVFEGMGLVYREPWERCTG